MVCHPEPRDRAASASERAKEREARDPCFSPRPPRPRAALAEPALSGVEGKSRSRLAGEGAPRLQRPQVALASFRASSGWLSWPLTTIHYPLQLGCPAVPRLAPWATISSVLCEGWRDG